MKPVVVRSVKIGDGIPKICVPIAEKSLEDIIEAAKQIVESTADLVEWRADWFEDILDFEKVQEVLNGLRNILGEMPILFTIRSLTEGGEKAFDEETYISLNKKAVDTDCADLIDVEVLHYKNAAKELAEYAHKAAVTVIASNHDFEKTPEEEQLISKIESMGLYGADILKIAMMPKTMEDVELLLKVSEKMKTKLTNPLVAISMSELGLKSRLVSVITFGTVGKASAPGQISAQELKNMIKHGIIKL